MTSGYFFFDIFFYLWLLSLFLNTFFGTSNHMNLWGHKKLLRVKKEKKEKVACNLKETFWVFFNSSSFKCYKWNNSIPRWRNAFVCTFFFFNYKFQSLCVFGFWVFIVHKSDSSCTYVEPFSFQMMIIEVWSQLQWPKQPWSFTEKQVNSFWHSIKAIADYTTTFNVLCFISCTEVQNMS